MITGSTTFAELALYLDARGLKLRQMHAVGDGFEVVLVDVKRCYSVGARGDTVHEALNAALECWEQGQ